MSTIEELQLQIYIIVGFCIFLFAALILATSLLIYYLTKLYKEKRDENAYLRKHGVESGYQTNNAYSNNALVVDDDELNRRYTMHRTADSPEPPSVLSLESFGSVSERNVRKTPKNSEHNNNVVKTKPSEIDVSEEFRWRQNIDGGSRYNSSIIMHSHETFDSKNEGRTAFND